MPKATMPTTFRGWIVALFASMIGFIAGFGATALASSMLGG
jgi:hypothetical protein